MDILECVRFRAGITRGTSLSRLTEDIPEETLAYLNERKKSGQPD
jgi:hypothetical protein